MLIFGETIIPCCYADCFLNKDQQHLLSDASLDTIRQFGVGFYVPEETSQLYKDKMNIDLTKDTSSRSVLPAPAIFIADTKGLIQFNYVNPNYRVRPSAELLLNAAKTLKQ